MRKTIWAGVGILMMACGKTAPAPTPTAPTPAAAPVPEALPSIEEVRALRTAGQFDRYEHALRLLATSTDAQSRGRAEALLGLYYLDHDRRPEAVPLLDRAAVDDPIIAPWMWLRIGDIPATNRVIQFGSDSTAGPLAYLRIVGLYAEAANVSATNGAYAQISSVHIDETNEDEFVRLARALSKAGRDDLAIPLRMRLLTEYSQGRFTEETYGTLAKAAASPLDTLSREVTIELAKKLGSTEHFDEALDLLQRFAQRAPAEAASTEVRDLKIRSLFQSRHYSDILAQFDEKSIRDSAAMSMLRARAAWRADRGPEVLAGLKRIEHDFPRSPETTEAKVLRAKYYSVDEPRPDLAIDNMKQAIAAGAYGNEGENLWTLGWRYYVANRYDEALATFAEYKKRYPDGDYLSNSLFWSGKIHDRMNRSVERDAAFDELQATYPYNYFSYRAREIRHQSTIAPSEIANGNVFPNLDTELAITKIHDSDRLAIIAELRWIGLYRETIANMKLMADGYRENAAVAFMLADAYMEGGEPVHANAVLQRKFRPFVRHGGTGIPRRLWEILYPLAYWDAFEREAAKQKVDPYLLASIARQESIFEPSTVSNAGAVGIMQIMPQEAARIATAGGLATPTREQLFDPTVNIAIGAAEYAQKRSAMNGNDTLAIAAYNAGTDAVGKWLAATPIEDGDLFVESIPFNETRLYVKTVTRNRFEYRRIYENGGSVQSSR